MKSTNKQFKELPLADKLFVIGFSLLVLMCFGFFVYIVFDVAFNINPL